MSSIAALAMLSEVVFSPGGPQVICTQIQNEVGKPAIISCPQLGGESKLEMIRTPTPEERPVAVAPEQIDGEKIWAAIDSIRQAQKQEKVAALKQRPPDQLTPEQKRLLDRLKNAPEQIATLESLPREKIITTTDPALISAAKDVLATQSRLEEQFSRDLLDWGIVLGLLLSLAALVGVFAVWRWGRSTIARFTGQIAMLFERTTSLDRRVTDIEDRYAVKVSKRREVSPLSLMPREMRELAVGSEFDYFVDVEGQLARYRVTVSAKTENGKDVKLVIPQLGIRAKSNDFHAALAKCIEQNGGMHPFMALEAA